MPPRPLPLPWRFDADSLSVEERFGYRRDVWPEAQKLIEIRPGQRVLDVGTGAGAMVRFAAEGMAGKGEIVGVDHDPAMLEKARASMPSSADLRIRFEEGTATKLPFADASFDATISGYLLCVIPDPLVALREMARVTRPGSVVASFSCFCKSGFFPIFAGVHDFAGLGRLDELRRRFVDVRRVHVRNPSLGLPSGRDLDVWADYARAGLVDLRIKGFLTVFAPSDARWTDAEAREYVESRRRIELSMLDNLTDAQRETIASNGFSRAEQAELRALLERKYAWLLEDDRRIRAGMELVTDPAVLIVGRVPRG